MHVTKLSIWLNFNFLQAYCPRGFKLDETDVNATFDENGHLVQPFKNCPNAIKKAKTCLSEPNCKFVNYTTSDCKMLWKKDKNTSIVCQLTLESGEWNLTSILQTNHILIHYNNCTKLICPLVFYFRSLSGRLSLGRRTCPWSDYQ